VSCGGAEQSRDPQGFFFVGWAAPGGAAHVVGRGYPGSYPPQLVPERLVPVVQRRLELLRAGANRAEQKDS